MRYAIVSKGLTVDELKVEADKVGARGIKETRLLNQIFCELSESQVGALSKVSGLAVKPLKLLKPDVIMMPDIAEQVVPQSTGNDVSKVFSGIRSLFSPPITGEGLTVAVLDTGIRKTHESLEDKVVYEENFSSSPSTDDVFGHGTQIASIIAGGIQGGEVTGVSPGASLMNIKVINDEGLATEEEVVLGIERVCELVMEAFQGGFWYTHPLWPNVINLSLGAEDDGDKDSPMRLACRAASIEYGLDVVASAGNYGPEVTTITSPGTEPEVITVGAIETVHEIGIWEKSSRGPTKLGDVKPDFVFWGVDVAAASSKDDTSYVIKSGTSFSTPMLSGLTGLLWETGRRVYGENWLFRWTEARELAPYYCLRPEDAPVGKGNTYGYGLPAVGTMVGRLAAARPVLDIENMMAPIIMMIMMIGVMRIV